MGFIVGRDVSVFGITNILEKGLLGNGTANDATALNTLLTAIGSTQTDLYFPSGTYKLATNVTIPSNVRLIFANGAKLRRASSAVITLNCLIDAGLYQILDDDGTGSWSGSLRNSEIYPEWFGAIVGETIDSSGAFQKSCDLLSGSIYGGTIEFDGIYRFDYPVFLKGNNINILGKGLSSHIISTVKSSTGRCAFVIGNSREWNYDKVVERRSAGTFGSLSNSNYTDPVLGTFIEPDNVAIESKNCSIRNCLIEFKYSNPATDWGGYAINIVNAAQSNCDNIYTINATEAVNIGSDVAPSTPACVDCHATNIFVINPDIVHTYYAIGFIANSQRCSINGAYSFTEMTASSTDGNLIATNVTRDCLIQNIQGKVGSTSNSEGVLINNSKNTKVINAQIENATKAFANYYTDTNYISATEPNIFENCIAKNCTVNLNLSSKYDKFINCKSINTTTDIKFVNVNATSNEFYGCDNKNITVPGGQNADWANQNNRPGEIVETGRIKYTYFEYSRYVKLLDIANGVQASDFNKVTLKSYTGTINFTVPLKTLGVKSVNSLKGFLTFAAGSQSASSSVVITLYRRSDFTGNAGASLTTEYTTTITPTADTAQDKTYDINNLGIEETLDQTGEILLEISWINPVLNSTLKNARVGLFS